VENYAIAVEKVMFRWLIHIIFLFLIFLMIAEPVWASVHLYPEPNGVLYRSLSTLQDSRDRAWQAVLFKRFQNERLVEIHLRLVGFPGVIELEHPRSLLIETRAGQLLTAEDVTPFNLPNQNVGEYDLQPVLAQLDTDLSFQLVLPLNSGRETLKLSKETLQEWWRVATWIEN
jgi:Protein of unknown function (DUF3122)